MDNMKMRYWCFSISFLLTLSTLVSATPQCVRQADGTNRCTTTDAWRLNILCRVMGSPSDGGGDGTATGNGRNNDGYIADALNAQAGDTGGVRKTRRRAVACVKNYYNYVNQELNSASFQARNNASQAGMLAKMEGRINSVSQRLYNANWAQSANRCGLATGPTSVCGDKATPVAACETLGQDGGGRVGDNEYEDNTDGQFFWTSNSGEGDASSNIDESTNISPESGPVNSTGTEEATQVTTET